MAKSSALFKGNDGYTHICTDCMNELLFDLKSRFKDSKIAMMILCHYLDVYFSETLYESLNDKPTFTFGEYMKSLSLGQYKGKSFTSSLLEIVRDGLMSSGEIQDEKEQKWSKDELKHKNDVLMTIGYDPFENYNNNDRKYLFNELIKYFDDDIAEDTYKLSQVIQIVNNNNQIRNYDILISKLDPLKDSQDIKNLNGLKSSLVTANDKIAKENEISVKNRSNKDVGKSTLTYLMKDLREKNIKTAEANYYDQLRSEGSQWAIEMSMKAIQQNGYFDENDELEIKSIRRQMVIDLQNQVDDLMEEKRKLLIKLQKFELGDK